MRPDYFPPLTRYLRAILPLLGEYVDSGYREPKARLLYSLRMNARYQLIVLTCATVGLIYISISIKFDFLTIKGLVMALAYVWGLVLAIYLMGHGLVSFRATSSERNISGRLRRFQARAPKVHERLMDAVNELESLNSQVAQLQQRKTGTARDFQEWIEELSGNPGSSDVRVPILEPADTSATIPSVITERYLADLTRRLQRARHMKARFVDEWDRLVQSAADIQTIMNSAASKKLEFAPSPRRSSCLPRMKFLTPYMRYQLYYNIIPCVRLVSGSFFAVASVCVVWSELIKSVAPHLSAVTLTVVPKWKDEKPLGFGNQVIASAWLLYMCTAALTGVNDVQVWGNRALVRRNTYGESACWYASLVARLTVPIAYNFLTILPKDFRRHTTFYNFLGN
jgi:LMBR1-like membrane protein.